MLDVAVLLVSELVANAVLHARTTIRVVIRLDQRRLRVEVHDGETRAPARKHYSSLSTTGRGLLLLERMAHDWGVVPQEKGESVWFELDPEAGGGRHSDPLGVEVSLDHELELSAVGDPPARGPARARGPDPGRRTRPTLRVGAGGP